MKHLKFNSENSLENVEIYDEMIRDPMSLKIAKNKDVPEAHKIEFFKSMIPSLNQYAKAMKYK